MAEPLNERLGLNEKEQASRLLNEQKLMISKLVLKLEKQQDDEKQKELKKRVLELFSWPKEPLLRESSIDMWKFVNARRGMKDCGEIAVKLKAPIVPMTGLDIFRIDLNDYNYFVVRNPELKIKLPYVYNPFFPEEYGSASVSDELARSKILAYLEFQKKIPGSNIAEIISAASHSILNNKKEKIKTIIKEIFKRIPIFQENAKYPKDIDPKKLERMVEDINNYKLNAFVEAVESATQYTQKLTKTDIESAKQIRAVIKELMPSDKSKYARKLDCTPWNAVIKHNEGTPNESNIGKIIDQMSADNLYFVDTGAYGYKSEDWLNIGDSYVFYKTRVKFDGKNMFETNTSDDFLNYLRKSRQYQVPKRQHHLMAFLNLMSVRRGVDDKFLKQYIELKGSGKEARPIIDFYEGLIRYGDEKSSHKLELLKSSGINITQKQNDAFAAAKEIIEKMSTFEMKDLVDTLSGRK